MYGRKKLGKSDQISCFCAHLLTMGHRKWFLKALGVQQFHKLLAGFENKAAQAVCTFAYSEGPGHEPIIFQGRTKVGESTGIDRYY